MQTCVQLAGDWLPNLSGDLGKDCAMQTCIFLWQKEGCERLDGLVYIHSIYTQNAIEQHMVTFLEHQLTESMVYDVILKRRLD